VKPIAHSYSSLKMFENCPKRFLHQRIERSVRDTMGAEAAEGNRIHKAFEDRLKPAKEPLPRDLEGFEAMCVSLEQSVGNGQLLIEKELTLTANLTPTSWWGKDAWLRSKLDVLVIKGPDATVIDWKTGKRRVDQFQLDLFAGQVFIHYPEVTTVNTAFAWTQDKALDTKVYMRSDNDTIWQTTLTKTARIDHALEADVWPARPSGLCKWCPCYNFCEYR